MSRVKTASYSAPALEKGLDIIELLSEEEIGLSQSEIARSLDRSVGEIFRMLMVLQARGYVTQDPVSDRYLLTTYIYEIAHRIPTIGRLTSFAEPAMRTLAKTINQSVHLAILSDDRVLVVCQTASPGNNVLSVRLGSKIDPWQASSGRVILAFQDEAVLEQLLATLPLPEDADIARIRADLDGIRRAGSEVRGSFVIKGVVNVSAPVTDHSGRAVAALTVPHVERYNSSLSIEECREKLVAAAAALSASIGGQPPSTGAAGRRKP